MKFATNICRGAGAVALAAFAAMPAWAQTAAAAAPTVDKGDTAWMMTSTVLVLMMILPGLALFYGGLTRSKNMLSTMTQIGTVTAICMIIWVGWGGNGYFFSMGALDFAGGTVVHIDSGVSALVACLILGKRIGYPQEPMPPHSLTLTSVGTGLLWVGWFGFNAGSALEANGSA